MKLISLNNKQKIFCFILSIFTSQKAINTSLPSKRNTWIQWWINGGPASQTVGQHWFTIGSACFVGWAPVYLEVTLYLCGDSIMVVRPLYSQLTANWTNLKLNPYNAEFFFIKRGDQRVYSIWNHHKCLSYLILIHLNTYVICLRPLEIF